MKAVRKNAQGRFENLKVRWPVHACSRGARVFGNFYEHDVSVVQAFSKGENFGFSGFRLPPQPARDTHLARRVTVPPSRVVAHEQRQTEEAAEGASELGRPARQAEGRAQQPVGPAQARARRRQVTRRKRVGGGREQAGEEGAAEARACRGHFQNCCFVVEVFSAAVSCRPLPHHHR